VTEPGESPPARVSAEASFDGATSTPSPSAAAIVGPFNLRDAIDELRDGAQYEAGGHVARTLVRLPDLRVVLFLQRRNTELTQHHMARPVTIQALMGRIRIGLPEGPLELTAGALLMVASGVAYSVDAVTDSAFLLSMPWSTRTETSSSPPVARLLR
jgi:quercetin dioxygenase-like cupin family protein